VRRPGTSEETDAEFVGADTFRTVAATRLGELPVTADGGRHGATVVE
jgi:hypothetical protein